MKYPFFEKLGKSAAQGVKFGVFALLSASAVTYALTYNWSDPSALRGKTSGDQIQSAQWNTLVTNVDNLNERLANAESALSAVSGATPTGAVVAFFGTSCPTGWSAANGTANGVKKTDGTSGTLDLRGEFVRGLDGGRGVDAGRTIGSLQNGSYMPLGNNGGVMWLHGLDDSVGTQSYWWQTSSNANTGWGASAFDSVWWSSSASFSQSWLGWGWAGTTNFQYAKIRPRNVALLYCVKN